VGISGVIEPSKDAARDLAEEDMKRSLGDDGYAEMLIGKHKKSVGWNGDDAAYRLKFGDSAARNQDVRNAALDGMSAEHAGDYYMDKCHDGSNAWCVAGVATNVGKSFLEMPVMIGGLAGLELKTASWAARGARLLGAGADTAAAVYDTTRFGFTAVNTAQMAVPIAADAVQAVEACRKGDSAGCKDHISGLAAAAGSMGAFKYIYGKGLGELNAKWGAGDAKWLADAALTDVKAGRLALDEGGAKVLEQISSGAKIESIEGIPAKYRENPAGLVADVAMGKIGFVENGGRLVAVKPAAKASAAKPAASPKPDALPGKDAVVKRFGGEDPLKLADEKGIRIGGVGGGGAKLIEINGEQWVVKSRNISTQGERARSAARHELLGRQLVSAFFGEFDTTEAMAYEDEGRAVFLNKYDPAAKADDARFFALSEPQRAQLSVLMQVFGLSDVNHGNILFAEGRKPVLIDMESITGEPVDAGKYGPDIVERVVDWGHAPFLDRNAYNDPAPYHAEIAKWRARFEDPAFAGQLDAALRKAGYSEPEAAAYKDALKENLASYEKNMDAYLDLVNGRHPKPPEPAVTRALHDPVGFAKDLFRQIEGGTTKTAAAAPDAPAAGATNPGKRGARAPKEETAASGAAQDAPPVHQQTPLESDYHDFALDPYAGGARGADFVVVEDIEPGATLEVRRSRAHPEDTAEVVRELEGMGFKTRLSDQFVEDHVAKRRRMAAYDRARRLDLPDGLKGDAFLAGGHFSAGDGGVVTVRASRSHPEASQAVADALKAGGFEPRITQSDFVEDYLAEQKEPPAGDEQAADEQPAAEEPLPQARNLPPRGPGTAVLKKPKALAGTDGGAGGAVVK
jgi:hypothetical protein